MRVIRFLLWAFVALCCIEAAAYFLGPDHVYSVIQDTCLECRATRITRRFVGMPVTQISSNECSSYILSHEPTHRHQWRWCGSEHGYSLLSESRACGRAHSIFRLSPDIQLKYARLVSPEEYQKALKAIDSTDADAVTDMIARIFEKVFDDGGAR